MAKRDRHSSSESLSASESSKTPDTPSSDTDTRKQYRLLLQTPLGVGAVRVIRPLENESPKDTETRALELASQLKDLGYSIEEQIAEPYPPLSAN